MRILPTTVVALATSVVLHVPALAQTSVTSSAHAGSDPRQVHAGGPHLHVNDRWRECSFQLDPSLTRKAWRQFTREAALVAYFRPLADARPLGRGHVEVAALQWGTAIDASDAAWNDTFVHPDSTHWLFEGSALRFPGIMVRSGVSDRTDIGLYVTKSPGANYGFIAGQVQHSLTDAASAWGMAARLSVMSLYGPEDIGLTVYGADALASRTMNITQRVSVSPYAGVSTYLSSSRERSSVVQLQDERAIGVQGMVGAAVSLAFVRLGVEYSVASVPTLSLKVGLGR